MDLQKRKQLCLLIEQVKDAMLELGIQEMTIRAEDESDEIRRVIMEGPLAPSQFDILLAQLKEAEEQQAESMIMAPVVTVATVNQGQLNAHSRGKSHAAEETTRSASARRRAAIHDRTPPWFGEFDKFVMQEAADLAVRRETATGMKWHVDHMIPLQAREASGLHCGNNLQVIPDLLNISKHNKMVLTEPGQWIGHLGYSSLYFGNMKRELDPLNQFDALLLALRDAERDQQEVECASE